MSDQETSSPFETIRHTTDDGVEYWSARVGRSVGICQMGQLRTYH